MHRSRLFLSARPIPCREHLVRTIETHINYVLKIYTYISYSEKSTQEKVPDGKFACITISGVPHSGKTALQYRLLSRNQEIKNMGSATYTDKLDASAFHLVVALDHKTWKEVKVCERRNSVVLYDSFTKQRQKVLKSHFLHVREVRGQVEFQNMLPLLYTGPYIFIFVFRADLNFKEKIPVEYKMSADESLISYCSSITTEEALIQCLASVYKMKACSNAQKPKVLIVGTHKNHISSNAYTKINEQLETLIEENGFKGLVHYSNLPQKGNIMFSVDNSSSPESDDFQAIRSHIYHLMHNDIFTLDLQSNQAQLVSNYWRTVAAKPSLQNDHVHHLSRLLQPEDIFTRFINFMIIALKCDRFTLKEADNFEKKGYLNLLALKKMSRKSNENYKNEVGILPETFMELLACLRIITSLPGQSYFLPCVLNNAPEEDQHENVIMPLAVTFKCRHCPQGLFDALIAHHMVNKGKKGRISLELLPDVYRNQVSFTACSPGMCDKVTMRLHSNHIEVKYTPEVFEERTVPLQEACSEVHQIIHASILRSLEDRDYVPAKVKPASSLHCDHCNKLHSVTMKNQMWCQDLRRIISIPDQGTFWFKGQTVSMYL